MIIMAAGVSSRMKASMSNSNLSDEQILQSNNIAKGFIRIGKKDETLIYHIIKNSTASKISDFFIILSKDSIEFQSYLKEIEKKLSVKIKFAFQDYYGKKKTNGDCRRYFSSHESISRVKNI